MPKSILSFQIEDEIIEKIDELADKAGISRSKLIVNILDESTASLIKCKKIGLYQFAILMRDMGSALDEWVKDIQNGKIKLPS